MLRSAFASALTARLRAIAVVILLSTASASLAFAQDRATAPPDPGELIGATVFAAGGREVGEVATVTVSSSGEISEMRMDAGSPLGVGPRTVVLPLESIMILCGAVVLNLSPPEVDALPTARSGQSREPNQALVA